MITGYPHSRIAGYRVVRSWFRLPLCLQLGFERPLLFRRELLEEGFNLSVDMLPGIVEHLFHGFRAFVVSDCHLPVPKCLLRPTRFRARLVRSHPRSA